MVPFRGWFQFSLVIIYVVIFSLLHNLAPSSVFWLFPASIAMLSLFSTINNGTQISESKKGPSKYLSFVIDVTSAVLVFLVASAIQPNINEVTPRYKVAEAIKFADNLMKEVTSSIENETPIKPVKILEPENIDTVSLIEVSEKGEISIFMNNPAALVKLRPSLTGKGLEWLCDGYPKKFVPAKCR